MDRLLRIVFLLASLTAHPAAGACGTYQTCNVLFITSGTAEPLSFEPGVDTVKLDLDLMQFSNWYWTGTPMIFTPQLLITAGDTVLTPALVDYQSLGPYFYGGYYAWWYDWTGFYKYHAEWDGKDASGNYVDVPTLLYVDASAGASHAYTSFVITPMVGSGKNDGRQCSKSVGDPCNLTTGNTYREESDYQSGSEMAFARHYNSRQVKRDVGLGFGWTAPYLRRVEVTGQQALIREADGRYEPARFDGTAWSTDADSRLHLTQDGSGFSLLRTDGSSDRYLANGRLATSIDARGRATAYSYNGAGQVATVTGPDGHTLAFSYGPDGRLATVTPPDGQSIGYTYDAAGNLSQISYPGGGTRQYRYADSRFPHHLTAVIDERGVETATYSYDDRGRAVTTTHARRDDGSWHDAYTLAYDSSTQTTVTDGRGEQVIYTHQETLGVKNILTAKHQSDGKGIDQTFNERNNLLVREDEEGRATTFEYNATNQLIRKVEAAGTPEARTTSYEYLAPDLALPTVIRSPSVVSGEYRVTHIAYNPNHLPTRIVHSGFRPDGTPVSRTLGFAYDAAGRLTTIDGPRGDVNDVTTYAWNDCTTGGGCGQLRSVTDALGHVTTYDSYDANARLTGETDPNGTVTRYTYDPRGRLAQMVRTPATGAPRTTSFSYDAAGRLETVTLPDSRQLAYEHDDSGLLRSVTDNLGQRVEYDYDAKGNATARRVRDPDGSLVTEVTHLFDLRDRLTQTNAAGSISDLIRDGVGNIVEARDPNRNAATHTYDALDRLLQRLDALGGQSHLRYDQADRITVVAAPNGATTRYVYDDLGNLLEEQSPDRGTRRYTYDEAGAPLTLTDARGNTANYAYDALGRLTSIDWPGNEDDVDYAYDGCANGVGRLCRMSDFLGATRYRYDGFGNRLSEQRRLAGRLYTTRYTWDSGDRLLALTTPDDRTVRYGRDAVGRIASVETDVNNRALLVASGMHYRADGAPTGMTLGNGLQEERRYDLQGRLESFSVGALGWNHTYDANGNLIASDHLGVPSRYTYDALNRLTTEASTAGDFAWTYDGNANRLTATEEGITTDYAYTPGSNRLTATGDEPVTLDPDGNTVSKGAVRFTYSPAGRLTGVWRGRRLVARYAYDGLGRRVFKSEGLSVTLFHYDPAGKLLLETGLLGETERRYVWAADRPLAQIEPRGRLALRSREEVTWLHTDHLLTPRFGTNGSGTVVWQWESDAFGAAPPDDDPDRDGRRATVNLRFPGQYFDRETGSHYNYFRTYDGATGRYLESDPMGLKAGLSTFTYAGAAPLTGFDPLGLERFGIGIEPPPSDAVSGGVLDPSIDPGHTFAYLTTDDGKLITLVSVGPSTPIGALNKRDYLDGNLDAVANWPLAGQTSTYEWKISGEQLKKCKAAFDAKKKNAGKYSPTNQCTSAAVGLAQMCGIPVPDGVSKVHVPPMRPVFDGYTNTLPNPYGLMQQLNQTMGPKVVPASAFK